MKIVTTLKLDLYEKFKVTFQAKKVKEVIVWNEIFKFLWKKENLINLKRSQVVRPGARLLE